MDQHFAEMLADSPKGTKKHENHDGKAHEHNGKDHRHGDASNNRHGHERLGAQSVGVELDKEPIDWVKFTSWLKGFLEKEGEVIWRLKGVLWTTAPDRRKGAVTTWGWGAGRRTVVQVRVRNVGNRLTELPIFVLLGNTLERGIFVCEPIP